MKNLKKIFVAVLILGLSIGVYSYKINQASASCGNGFSYCRTVTIAHSKVPNTDQLSFPILICFNGASPCNTSLPGLNQSGGGAHVQNSNGYDIIFTTDSGCTTQVTAWEIETYVASTGELEAWVNDGTLSHTSDTVFYMCYGKASISTFQSTASAVWDSNFKAVYHLPNGTSLTANDSTSNRKNGSLINSPTAVAGQIGGAANFVAGSSQAISLGSFSMATSTGSVSIWWKPPTIATNYAPLFDIRTASPLRLFDFYSDTSAGGSMFAGWYNNGTDNRIGCNIIGVVTNNVWQLVTLTWTAGGNTIFYVNGVSKCTAALASSTTWDTTAGTAYINYDSATPTYGTAVEDEIRVSNTARSIDWIATEYNNQSSPSTFESFGSEQTSSVPLPHAQVILLKSQTIINKSQPIIN